ncbi:uncharacterized protein STEHIDRAFT_112991 [Stereum hirsutum FP-91666 SS1]|uniref:uncharacterized protein n=1 Tax=Stereum hirsutum (strain FP-91666) TaxID=721885 RepID=UPI0004449287|nr:uncharacterized protein STEHIDRAFT_112991 [Stereum hirsutum FP-91666 SS1]EIM83709.1 hypothetical protein STEHIDRAFT_112991 [Stereum hirsutum FP-91666 SS1]
MQFSLFLFAATFTLFLTGIETARRAQTTLTDGTQTKDVWGKVAGMSYVSSGILIEGCPSSIKIDDCITLQETSDPTKMLDNGAPKQRIEFYDAKEKDGVTATYNWKYYLSSKTVMSYLLHFTCTTNNFFFLMQLYTDSLGEPVVDLSAIKDKVFIKDVLNKGLCPKSGCPSVALGDHTDRVTQHSMTVTFGVNGKMAYKSRMLIRERL